MRLNSEAAEVWRAIVHDCHEAHTDDVLVAAVHAELDDLAGGGIVWAADLLDACLRAGLKARITSLLKSSRCVVGETPMPRVYATPAGQIDWLTAPIDSLNARTKSMRGQARTIGERAEILAMAKVLCAVHGVNTAAEAFELEGIAVVAA